MDQIFLDGDFRYFTLQHWIKFALVGLYVFFGLFVAKKSIKVWTTPGNSFWWALFLYPFTVLKRNQWCDEEGVMYAAYGTFGATIRPFFLDFFIGEHYEHDDIFELIYCVLHIFFWPIRVLLNLFTALASLRINPVIKELDRKIPV